MCDDPSLSLDPNSGNARVCAFLDFQTNPNSRCDCWVDQMRRPLLCVNGFQSRSFPRSRSKDPGISMGVVTMWVLIIPVIFTLVCLKARWEGGREHECLFGKSSLVDSLQVMPVNGLPVKKKTTRASIPTPAKRRRHSVSDLYFNIGSPGPHGPQTYLLQLVCLLEIKGPATFTKGLGPNKGTRSANLEFT